jgi:hypothetical protein
MGRDTLGESWPSSPQVTWRLIGSKPKSCLRPSPNQTRPNRPLKKSGLMLNGTWQMVKQRGFAIFHLPFAIQDAFFSILLRSKAQSLAATPGRGEPQSGEGLEHLLIREIRIPAARVREHEQAGAVDGFGLKAEGDRVLAREWRR